MADYNFIEKTGLVLPDTETLKSAVEAEFLENFGDDLVVTPESPAGLLIAAETESRDAIIRNNAELANQINPHYAGGVFLDAIAALTGLTRRAALQSTVTANLSGTPYSVIPKGSRASTVDGAIFQAKSRIVLDENGQAEALFVSEEYGEIPCPAGDLTTIMDAVLGWEAITNKESASLGNLTESDAAFRERRRQTLYLQGVALPGAILSAVLDVDGVASAIFRENVSYENVVIDGVAMIPHSIYVCVDGGTDQDIAKALLANKSLGCGYNGTVNVAVKEENSGQNYNVSFARPEEVPLRAAFTVKLIGTTTLDAEELVREAVLAYVKGAIDGLPGFAVGQPASPFEMAGAIVAQYPALMVLSAKIGLLSTPLADLTADTLTLEIWQKASLSAAAIDVSVS